MQVNEDKLNQLIGKVVGKMGAAMNTALGASVSNRDYSRPWPLLGR